ASLLRHSQQFDRWFARRWANCRSCHFIRTPSSSANLLKMTACLPPNLLALFEARPPIPYLPPPTDLLIEKKEKGKVVEITGIAEYVSLFEDPKDTPPKPIIETKAEKKERRRREKEELLAYKVEQGIAQWNPADNPNATEDPYKTLFVARINYETSENKLKREFETYGKIKKLAMIHDLNGKPRGYAFIEYSDKAEMSNAYKRADGTKVDGRRLIVDYERGRTQKSWLPRRLGGGKGDTRRARESRAAIEEREAAGLPPVDGVRDRDRDRGDSPRGPPKDSYRDHDRNGSSRHRSRSRDRGYGSRGSDRGHDRDRFRDRGSRDNGYGRDDRRSGGFRGPPPSYGGGRDRR
ncbi:hypothetical protein OSTOST_04386, partial [Ostertagia ostertagi]